MDCRYMITDCTNPYKNLAMEQLLMGHVSKGMYILFLWQNDNTVVIGRNQDAYAECKVDELYEAGGCLARRRSGGGAVYHDLGNLNYSVITHTDDDKKISYQWLVGTALEKLGIYVEFNGRNDLTFRGRKFSGNAKYTDKGRSCQHGTILVSSDIQRMEELLTPEKEKLGRNNVSSVGARVMNLNEILIDITIEEVQETLIEVTKAHPFEFDRNDYELEGFESFYSGKEWIFEGNR